jgi:hypothetical protein
MHIEKNMFENIFNIIMDMKGKTKDNIKTIMNISLFSHRKNIELIYDGSRVIKLKVNYPRPLEGPFWDLDDFLCVFVMICG